MLYIQETILIIARNSSSDIVKLFLGLFKCPRRILFASDYKGKCIKEVPLSYLRWVIATHEEKAFLRSELQYEYMCCLTKK